MNELIEFINDMLKSLGINDIEDITIEETRAFVEKLNAFLYTNYKEIGTTTELDSEFEYISNYHKFWKRNCEEILKPSIDFKQCEKMAEVFHNIYINNKEVFYSLYDKEGLRDEEICKIRFYTASQDFNGSREFKKYAELYKSDNSIFDKEYIFNKTKDFMRDISITIFSQNDKRIKFAKESAELLINLDCEPYELIRKKDNDLKKLREDLISKVGTGFGNKKADMFLRDMVVLKIWNGCKNFDILDVASDINTMKVALRSGILKTEIPLVSSFLDVFCYQYGLMDKWTAKAWREVWNIWKEKYPKECVEGPALMDYLLYMIIGKEFCNEYLCIYKGDECGHIFKWYDGRKKKCQICAKDKKNVGARVIKRVLPCQDEEGYICIEKSKYVNGEKEGLKGIKECPLKTVCQPERKEFIKYNGPKSISILGETGWDTARVRTEEGGGGLMA